MAAYLGRSNDIDVCASHIVADRDGQPALVADGGIYEFEPVTKSEGDAESMGPHDCFHFLPDAQRPTAVGSTLIERALRSTR